MKLITDPKEKKKLVQQYKEEYKRLTGKDLMCSEVPRKRGIGKYRKVARKYIVDISAEYFEINKEELIGESKKGNLPKARQYIAYLLNETKETYSETARILQYKDHSTVIHNIKVLKDELSVNKYAAEEYKKYKEYILTELEKRFIKKNQLTKEQIDAVLYSVKKGGITRQELADIYQVSRNTINQIVQKSRKNDKS